MIANEAMAGVFTVVVIFILISLLVQKELASAAGSRFKTMARIVNLCIPPLMIAFLLIVTSKVIDVIGSDALLKLKRLYLLVDTAFFVSFFFNYNNYESGSPQEIRIKPDWFCQSPFNILVFDFPCARL